MAMDKDDDALPLRPGEIKKPVQDGDGNVPFVVYINRHPVHMTKIEALGVIAQITQIMLYLETNPEEGGKE
jgi:hypothetical protein